MSRSAAGRPDAARAPPRAAPRPAREVVQHEQQRRRVELAVAIGSASSSPRRTSTLGSSRTRRRAACSISRERRRRSPARRTARARPRPGRSRSPRSPTTHSPSSSPGSACRSNARRRAPAAGDPTARPRTRRTPATGLAPAEDAARRRSSCSAPGVWPICSRSSAQSRASPARGRRAPACSSGSCRRAVTTPSGVGQRLQVTADRRLRELEDGAQLRHRQLVALEHQQHPAAGRVGQGREVLENRGIHPYIRMKCYIRRRRSSTPPGVRPRSDRGLTPL